ncbi:MAG: hypothetical protein CMF74_14955 [Maricaulis sp.]|jgi:protein-tyrosine phosphatase|nr:hypothetical protein [Maricaulis sp.]HAQ33843.1 protein-tyrosine-phosphatase [Alphaproteobacteria bacterium]|tara:strand:- start:83 stop:853 length:771 start_codon:yes stop_codon:yes gene_type:complete
MSRVLAFDGIRNFRHFGDYETRDGARVRSGLFRSGHFARASDADCQRLAEMKLTVVTDLRRPLEREREPSRWDDVLNPRVLASDFAGHAEPPHLVFLREGDHSAAGIRDFMLSTYRRLPTDPGNQQAFAAGLRALGDHADAESFVVHCAAGKDRTGIFCAMTLELAGVDRDTVIDDYLATNTAVDYDSLVPEVAKSIADRTGSKIGPDEMRLFLGVEADYLAQAFEVMGPAEVYMRDVLGLDEDEIARLRDALVRG